MTSKLDPYHTGPATDPLMEPTPTELLAWLRGREAVVDRKLGAYREGMLQALDVRLEPITTQLSELQLQADATDRRLDQHIVDPDQPHSAQSYYNNPVTAELRSQVDMLKRRLEGHIRSVDSHPHAREVAEEPDGVLVGPSGDGQSDLDMVKYSQLLRDSYRTFMRFAADPTIPKQKFDLAVHEFRENVFELTSWMRTAVSSREEQGAQAT